MWSYMSTCQLFRYVFSNCKLNCKLWLFKAAARFLAEPCRITSELLTQLGLVAQVAYFFSTRQHHCQHVSSDCCYCSRITSSDCYQAQLEETCELSMALGEACASRAVKNSLSSRCESVGDQASVFSVMALQKIKVSFGSEHPGFKA